MPSSVSQPLHKYSVILNNYRRPSDRFMAGGYATGSRHAHDDSS